MAAFRETYANLHEMRSLAPKVKIIAVTATATASTRKTIMDVLLIKNPYVISESPFKQNIAYSVQYIPKDRAIEDYFKWLKDDFVTQKDKFLRTVIYCQTIKQCSLIYSTLKAMLGNIIYVDESKNPRNVIIEMLHSCSPKANKETVLEAFQHENSGLKVLVATIAFGMGIDCKGVYRTIHFGPAKNIEAHIQETGRAGRDGKQSVSYVIYQGILLSHVDKEIKDYVKTDECRRKTMLKYFDTSLSVDFPEPIHLCCDNCALHCQCKSSDCGKLTTFPGISVIKENDLCEGVKKRTITPEQKTSVYEHLQCYHKSLITTLIEKSANGQLKTLTDMSILLGFSEVQIAQVVASCEKLFTLQDILDNVEIWDLKHAHKVLEIMFKVFGDVCDGVHVEDNHAYWKNDSSFVDDDGIVLEDVCDNWDDLVQDDSLLELVMDNLSLSRLSTQSEGQLNTSHIPDAALEVLQNHF